MIEELSPAAPEFKGQAWYTARRLRAYDLLVLHGNGHLAWRCGPRRMVAMYDRHLAWPHLDIGVGTGYLLDRCRPPRGAPDLTLMDINPNPLAAASARLARYAPATHQANAGPRASVRVAAPQACRRPRAPGGRRRHAASSCASSRRRSSGRRTLKVAVSGSWSQRQCRGGASAGKPTVARAHALASSG